ncbi:MAG: hypothetical protein V3T28_11000 [Gemmatimonadales bacterium]
MKRIMLLAMLGLAVSLVATPPAACQGAPVVGYSVTASSSEAAATFQLTDGTTLRVAFRNGNVLIGDERVGQYVPGGELDNAWRLLLSRSGDLSTDEMVAAARAWNPTGIGEAEAAPFAAIAQRLQLLQAMQAVPAPPAPPAPPDIAPVVAEAREAAEVARRAAMVIRNELRTTLRDEIGNLRQSVRRARAPSSDFQVDFGPVVHAISPVQTVWEGLLGLLGAFLALGGIAFGASFFARRQLDVVADTVSTSFARSFFVGLFAQPLIVPVLGMTLVGLTLTVVGILLIPVALIAFPIVLATAVIGGYLAVARVAGAGWLVRKRQDYGIEGLPLWKSVACGLAIVLAIWLPAILLGWAPVAGEILTWTAVLVTWGLATTGFGAMILSRGGLRGTFGRKFAPPPVTPDELFDRPETRVSTSEWLAGKQAAG